MGVTTRQFLYQQIAYLLYIFPQYPLKTIIFCSTQHNAQLLLMDNYNNYAFLHVSLLVKPFFTLITSSISYLGIAIKMISKEIFDTCPEIKIVTEYDDPNFYNFSLTIRDFRDEHPNEAFTIKDFMDYMKNRFENSSWGSRSKFLMNYEVLSVYLDKLVSLRNAIRKEYQSLFYYKIISSPSRSDSSRVL